MKIFLTLIICFLFPTVSMADSGQPAYDRVISTNILQCAYIVYPPETIKDPNTGKLSGTVIDTMEELGKKLNIKINWVEEVAFTNMFEGLKSGRHDSLCSGLYENAERSKAVLFSIPSNYGVTYAFSRADDNRFDNDFSLINDNAVTIATIDGEIAQTIAEETFPKAKQLALPQLSDISMVLESIATGKADIAFLQTSPAKKYIQNNPEKIKIVGTSPIRSYPAPPLAFSPNEIKLKLLFDSAIRELLLNGKIESILRKYDSDLDSYLLVNKPYKTQQ